MKNGAFTLLEVLVAVILIGLAVVALLGANRAFTLSNSAGLELSTAEFLIEQVKELTILLPVADPESGTDYFGPEPDEAALADYDDVDDFDNAPPFRPPINAERQQLEDLSAYSQQVTVQKVDSSNFEQLPDDDNYQFVRVSVKIYHNSKLVDSANWIRARF